MHFIACTVEEHVNKRMEAGKDGRAKNQGLKKWKNLC